MTTEKRTNSLSSNNPYKIVGLIASVITILAVFIGAVMWVSINMANNTISIETLQKRSVRHEILISENAEILIQHAQLLAIMEQQQSQISTLNSFMVQGGRFTEADGRKLHEDLQSVKDQLQHYQVLEVELSWIKNSIVRIEENIAKRFDGLHKKLDINNGSTKKEDR